MKVKNKVKQIFALIMAGTLSSGILVGCGNTQDNGTKYDEQGRIIITFAGRGLDSEKNNYSRFINDFMESNNDIYVDIEWRASEDSHNAYLANSSTLPTVFMLDNRQFIPYASAGRLYDMTESVAQEELDLIYEDSHDIYWWDNTTKMRGQSDNAKLYGLPKDQGPWVLCYNKELYDRCWKIVYGANSTVEYPDAREPMTFDSFMQLLETLVTPATKAEVGSSLVGIAAYDLETAINSNNASFFKDNSAKEADITSDNFVEAVEFVCELQNKGFMPSIATSSSGGYQVFCSGMSLFFYCGPWDIANFWAGDLAFEFDLMPVLRGNAEGSVATSRKGSMGYVVSNAASSEEKEAAVRLARYLAINEQSQRTQYQVGQAIPNVISMTNEYVNDTYNLLTGKAPSRRIVFTDVVSGQNPKVKGKFEAAAYTYSTAWLNSFNEYLRTSGVWTGDKSVRTAMQDYNATLQAELAQMQYML